MRRLLSIVIVLFFSFEIGLNAQNVDDYLSFAENLQKSKNYKEAIEYLSKAIIARPLDDNIFVNRGNNFLCLGDTVSAEKDYEAAIKINPKNSAAYNNLGAISKGADQLLFYKEAILQNRKDFVAYYNIGQIFGEKDEYEKALLYYDTAISISSSYYPALLNRAILYNQLNQIEKARAAYKKVIELYPNNETSYYNLGHIYIQLKKYHKAFACFDKCILLNKTYYKAYIYRASCRKFAFPNVPHYPHYKLALEDYLCAIEGLHNDYRIYFERAVTHFRMKKYSLVLADLNTSLSLRPQDINSHYMRAKTYIKLKDNTKAKADLDMIIKLDSSFKDRVHTEFKKLYQ